MRTIVDLPSEQIDALKRLGEAEHLSRAELMRRAVAEYVLRHQPATGDDAFGLWKKEAIDGLDYEANIRVEWNK